MTETESTQTSRASPLVLPEERPEGLVSTRAREILESMRLQRESFLASIQPTEAESAARQRLEKPDPPAARATESGKPPLFTTSEAESITRKLNESIKQRKERLARFSTSSDRKYRSARMASSDFRKITQSPHSHTTASSTAESSSFLSTPTEGSSLHGYDSDGSAQFAVPLPQYPNLEEIEETINETESERDVGEHHMGTRTNSNMTMLNEEEEETELEITVHSDMTDSIAETEASKPMGAPMMTLFGHASFDESVTRPPKMVHCTSFSLDQDNMSSRKEAPEVPMQPNRDSSKTVASGLSQFSSGALGPLGPTVEQRKKALLRTLSNTVAELEKMNVDVEEEISSVVSSLDGRRRSRNRQRTSSSSFSSIGVSSASSYSVNTAEENSQTSGWISPDLGSKNSTLRPRSRVYDDDTIATDQSCSESTVQEVSHHSPASSVDYNFENPLGDLMPTDSEAESKLLFTPPSGDERKKPEKTRGDSTKEASTSKSHTSARVTFDIENTKVRLRTPDPEELNAIAFPRGNLWNIAKSSGLSFEDEEEDDGGPVRIRGKPVFRSFDYVAYAAEYKCGARGGHFDLALASGMPKSAQISPLRKLKTPRVNGRRRWKLKARGGNYHLAVWTNLTNNLQSPSSIFRDRPEKAPTMSPPRSLEETPCADVAQIAARIRRLNIKCGAKGSFHYLSFETRRDIV